MNVSLDEVPEVSRAAALFLRGGLLRIFGPDLETIWLYGASVFGPHAIDVDLHILLHGRPMPEQAEALLRLHQQAGRDIPGLDIDSWYILSEDARRADPPANVGPWAPGYVDKHWAFHRAHWLAGARVVVYGKAPEGIVPAPSWDDLERALREEADEAARHLDRGSAYWTLQLCRIWTSLETRDVVRSKLDSGEWALERLPSACAPIIHAARRYYSGADMPGDLDLIKAECPAFYHTIRPLIDAVK